MGRALDVCIRGGGVVGHALAMLLARERLSVGLLAPGDPASARRADVRAYALNAASRELLRDLRCWPEPAHATPVSDMHVKEAGAEGVHFSAADSGVEALAWIVDVPALEAQLHEAVRYQPRIELLEAPHAAALTVICEGQASATRDGLGIEREVTPYAQWAIAARVECEIPHAGSARQWFTPHDVLAFLPLNGDGGNSMAVVWSVAEAYKAELMQLDEQAFADRLQSASESRFGKVRLASARAAWPLQLAVARRWCGTTDGQAWVLAGDAAHTVHPLAGQGLNLGLADARELASRIQGRAYWRTVGDPRILRGYERARKADVALMGAATDGLQQLFARPGEGWRGLRHWGMQGFERSGIVKRWVARRAMGMEFADRGAKLETERGDRA